MTYEIVPILYDVNTVEFAVKNTFTNRYVIEGCRTYSEAEAELDHYRGCQETFNAGPYATPRNGRAS